MNTAMVGESASASEDKAIRLSWVNSWGIKSIAYGEIGRDRMSDTVIIDPRYLCALLDGNS